MPWSRLFRNKAVNEVLECQRKLLVYTEQVRTKHANHQCRWVLLKTRKWA